MDNIEYTRLIMIKYSLRLVEYTINNNYLLVTSSKDCLNIVWDCQSALLEFNDKAIPLNFKQQFLSNTKLQYSYAIQLLNIANQAVSVGLPEFSHITMNMLNKIVVI